MTILSEHPWLLLLYILSVGIHLLVTMMPQAAWLGWVCAGYHAVVLTVFFLTGAEMEDVLLYLLLSVTAALAFALFLPDKRENTAGKKTETHDEGEESK